MNQLLFQKDHPQNNVSKPKSIHKSVHNSKPKPVHNSKPKPDPDNIPINLFDDPNDSAELIGSIFD